MSCLQLTIRVILCEQKEDASHFPMMAFIIYGDPTWHI